MLQMTTFSLDSTFLRLRSDASVEPLTVDGTFWGRLSGGQLGDFHNEYLVSSHTADSDWKVWEMHPNGDEVVCLLSGRITFVLDQGDAEAVVELTESGSFFVVPKGTWHTARVPERATMLFITAGEGTQHRAVES